MPLQNTTMTKDYTTLLFNRFILPHYQALAKEVHLINFDASHSHPFNPKQKWRGQCHDYKTHNHISFTPTTKIPTDWRAFIDCRQCK